MDIKDEIKDKGHKLARAVYLVSGFIHDNDPIKWRLREQAIRIAGFADLLNPEGSLADIGLMNSFLDIASTSSQVSAMNLSILKQEYQALGELLSGAKNKILILGGENKTVPALSLPKVISKGQKPVARSIQPIVPESSPRREQILNFIKSHGESSIKDISQAVPRVSSKTVQRELAEMVKTGILLREGDRRWSRYRISV